MPEIGMYVCVSREKNLRGQPEELREFDQTSIHSKAKQRALLLLIFTSTLYNGVCGIDDLARLWIVDVLNYFAVVMN